MDVPRPPLATSLRRRNSLGLSDKSMISCVNGVSSSSSAIHTRWNGVVRVSRVHGIGMVGASYVAWLGVAYLRKGADSAVP